MACPNDPSPPNGPCINFDHDESEVIPITQNNKKRPGKPLEITDPNDTPPPSKRSCTGVGDPKPSQNTSGEGRETDNDFKRTEVEPDISIVRNDVGVAGPNKVIGSEEAAKYTLTELSDDVIMMIFRLLSTVDLLNVAETCKRLQRISTDQSLWMDVSTELSPMPLQTIRKLVKCCHSRTKRVCIQGYIGRHRSQTPRENISASLLHSLSAKSPDLETLDLRDCYMSASKVTLKHFPTSLKRLCLVNCEVVHVPERESFFKDMHLSFPHLEELNLTNCGWVTNHSLLSLCKCEKLRVVNLRGCFKIGETFAYTALATRFGFRNVEIMDLRDTCIGNSEVSCFGRLPKMRRIMFGRSSVHSDPSGAAAAAATLADPPYPPSEGDGRISDRGIESMCPMAGDPPSEITHLSLQNTLVTNKVIKPLADKLKKLQWLDLTGTKVTPDGVSDFKKFRSDCKVIYTEE